MGKVGGQKGNKGGGRPSARDEAMRELVIQKALGKYLKALTRLGDDKNAGMTDKQFQRIKEMCLPVVVKDITNKIGNPDGSKLEVNVINYEDNTTI